MPSTLALKAPLPAVTGRMAVRPVASSIVTVPATAAPAAAVP